MKSWQKKKKKKSSRLWLICLEKVLACLSISAVVEMKPICPFQWGQPPLYKALSSISIQFPILRGESTPFCLAKLIVPTPCYNQESNTPFLPLFFSGLHAFTNRFIMIPQALRAERAASASLFILRSPFLRLLSVDTRHPSAKGVKETSRSHAPECFHGIRCTTCSCQLVGLRLDRCDTVTQTCACVSVHLSAVLDFIFHLKRSPPQFFCQTTIVSTAFHLVPWHSLLFHAFQS